MCSTGFDKEAVVDKPALSRRGFLGIAASVTAGATATILPNMANSAVAGSERDVLDVAIIGAGLAGLTAARDLRRAGCESFVILEARDRVGGRTYNHDLGNGYFSEAGGQWIGPGQTAIADLARELGIGTFLTRWEGKYCMMAGDITALVDCEGYFETNPELRRELEELAKGVPSAAPWTAKRAREFDSMSLADWLATKNLSPADQLGWAMGAQLTTGTTPNKLSLLHYLALINSAGCNYLQLEAIKGGAQESRISGGSQILSIKMAEALSDKIRMNSPVMKIENWQSGPATIYTTQGIIRARSVIVALSPSLCQQITFDPPLPEKRREMQRRWPAYAPMRKTAHVYKKAFWQDKGLNGMIVQLNGPVQWCYDNSPEDGSLGVISAFINNGMLPSDPQDAKTELCKIYARVFGEEAMHPLHFFDQDWGRVDRWSLSCTSPIPPGFLTQYGDVLHPSIGRLIWAGTETAEIWITTMDGAIRSGHKAALLALQAGAGRKA
ncbi:FAD-dependent oxidoreductase [Pseudoduganella sp. FT93W]|uniref:FAD-dependent oxidoreductase n=1 Tax=Duganella fentianensis TaxID=2692177 RepID=A0A845HZ54_9BURK|nr:FAD-dependent oxidoreductase [Duganella fentianensis]MYN44761.1 FAD-dependent oxidoreductase [Duganella fentianensis]